MAIICDSEGDDSFGVIVLTFAENSVSLSSNTTDPTKLPFQRFSLKL